MSFFQDIKNTLPFEVQFRPAVINNLKKQIKGIQKNKKYVVVDVMDSGNIGGVVCVIDHGDEGVVISLTHVIVDENHPLSAKIKKYQFDRMMQLRRNEFRMGEAK